MKLFVDHIRAHWRKGALRNGIPLPDDSDPLWWVFNSPVFVNSDAIVRVIRGEVDLEQLPSFTPPYGNMFIEVNIPFMDSLTVSDFRMALLLWGYDKQHPEQTAGDGSPSIIDGCMPLDEIRHRWTLNIHIFFEIVKNGARDYADFADATVFLDNDGKPLPMMHGETVGYSYVQLVGDLQEALQTETASNTERTYKFAETALDAGMYTLGMLHCRNIGTEVFEPKRAEAHKFERKYGIPMTRYHVLKITGKGRDAGELIGVDTGRRMPLHWVRGHWRTYTDAAPLFGNITGTFYVHEHIRGTLKAGAVVKDYEVKS